MATKPQDDARSALDAAGQLPDAELDIAAVALQLARIDAPEADWRAAEAELTAIARRAVELASADPEADAGDPQRRRALLAQLLHEEWGFTGDAETYEDMANANLIHVLERRRGLSMVVAAQHTQAKSSASRVELLRPALEKAAAEARQLELPAAQVLKLFQHILNEGEKP